MALLPTNVETPPVAASPTPLPARRRLRSWFALVAVVVFLIAGWLGGRAWWAAARWKAAEQALARYEFAEALDEFEGYLRIWPNSVPAHLQAARAARRAEQYERAAEHLAVAEEAGVTPETALENVLARAQQGDLAGVDRPLEGLIRDGHPEATLIAEALARGFMKVFRLPAAWVTLSYVIDHAPDHASAYFWRAGIGEVGSRVSNAIADLRHAVRLAPHRREYRLKLAEVLVKNARANEAWPHFQELLRSSPNDPTVLLGAARCLRALAQPAQAAKHLDMLLRDHPDHAEGWAERGLVYGDQGKGADALRCLRKAFALDPGNYTLGVALYAELKAQGYDREATPLRKQLDELKRNDERLVEFVQQLAKTPRNAGLRYEMGLICLDNKAETAALRWFTGALQDDPNHRLTHRALADFYERKGDTARAEFHRERAGP